MKVKTLINVLSRMNPDADVLVQNDNWFDSGLYHPVEEQVQMYGNSVLIGTDYKRKEDSWYDT